MRALNPKWLLQGEGAAASLPPGLDPTIMQAQGTARHSMLTLVGKAIPASQEVGVMPAQFWAAGFSFSRAELFAEVCNLGSNIMSAGVMYKVSRVCNVQQSCVLAEVEIRMLQSRTL